MEVTHERIVTPKLVFVGVDGKVAETLFISHVPASMAKKLISEKKFLVKDAKNEDL